MQIQPPDKIDTLAPRRQSMNNGSPGAIGELRFNSGQGCAPRGASPDDFLGLGGLLFSLIYWVESEPEQGRAGHTEVEQMREMRGQMDSLLGNLMTPTDDAPAQSRIAQGLKCLAKRSRGDLSNLPGGWEALSARLGEMEFAELDVLRDGVLGQAAARNAVLEQIPPDLRAWAQGVLEQMISALNPRWAQEAVSVSLSQIAAALSASPVDGRKLEAPMGALHAGLAMLEAELPQDGLPFVSMLDIYLQSLPVERSDALLTGLRPDKLAGGRRILSKISDVLERQQALAVLESLGALLGRKVHTQAKPALLKLEGRLARAVQAEDKLAASHALHKLCKLVDTCRQDCGPLAPEMVEEVRRLVARGLDLIRDPQGNPHGPLNGASLSKVDDFTLKHLREASSSLRPMGLELDRAAADSIGLQRVEALSRRTLQGIMDVFRLLSQDSVDVVELVQRLRGLSGVALQRIQQLADLGQFVGGLSADARLTMAQELSERVMSQLLRGGQAAIVHDAMRHMDLLESLQKEFCAVMIELGTHVNEQDYEHGALDISKQVSTTYHLLSGMVGALYDKILDLTGTDLIYSATPLPKDFYRALREQYGVNYDASKNAATVLLTDGRRSHAAHSARLTSPAHGYRVQTLDSFLEEAEEVSFADPLRVEDLIRHDMRLSVRGTGADSLPTRFIWPDQVTAEDLPRVAEEAIEALARVAGPVTATLADWMNYEHIATCLLKREWALDVEPPFRLEDDTAVHPEGEGALEVDVARNEDGSFTIATTFRFTAIRDATGLRPDGAAVTLCMNPESSWAEVHYCMQAAPDASRVELAGLPQFRYHFDVLEIME